MKRFLILMLSLVLCFSSLSMIGCKEEQAETQTDSNIYLLNDFENFDRDIQLVRVFDGMGGVDENRDMKYVKSGERSLVAKPVGLHWITRYPCFVLPTTSITYKIDEGDFSKVEKVTLWVYNDSEEVQWMSMGLTELTRTHQYAEAPIRTIGEYYDLLPGWNYIEYYVQHQLVGGQDGFDIKGTLGLFFEFDRSPDCTVATANTFYFDEVRLHKFENGASYQAKDKLFDLKVDEANGYWEVADFEDTMQAWNYYIPYVVPSGVLNTPNVRVVNAKEHNVAAKSGANVLEIRKRAGAKVYAAGYLRMTNFGLKEAFANIGQDLIDNPQNYVLRFDMYNPNSIAHGVTMEISADRSYDSSLTSDNAQTTTYFSQGTTIPAKSWITYERNLATIDNNIISRAEKLGKEPVSFVKHPGGMSFSWTPHKGQEAEDRIILIDNVRIEKVQG